jgi:hypothetical protein
MGLCVISWRYLRRDDYSSSGVLLSVVRLGVNANPRKARVRSALGKNIYILNRSAKENK